MMISEKFIIIGSDIVSIDKDAVKHYGKRIAFLLAYYAILSKDCVIELDMHELTNGDKADIVELLDLELISKIDHKHNIHTYKLNCVEYL